MYRVPPTTVSARIATATGRQAQVSDRRGETPVAVKRGARVSWFSFTGTEGSNPSPSSGESRANLTSSKPAPRWQRFADGCGTPLSPTPNAGIECFYLVERRFQSFIAALTPPHVLLPSLHSPRTVFVGQTILWASRARLWGHFVSPTKGWLGSRAKERSRRARSPAPFGAAAGSAVAA